MKAEEIKDRKTLEAWLQERPRREVGWLARRAALRVLPNWFRRVNAEPGQDEVAKAIAILRCLLVSGVPALEADVDVRSEAESAAIAAEGSEVDGVGLAGVCAARYALVEMEVRLSSDRKAAQHADAQAREYALVTLAFSLEFGFEAVNADLGLISTFYSERYSDLWSEGAPEWFTQAEKNMLAFWDADPPDRWDFWRRWWEGVKTGQPLDPELQLAIVKGIDNETWKDPDKVAEAIAKIEGEFVPPLSEAAFSDFRFDTVHQWMVLADFDDDLSHLRDPEVIRAFHEDCEDLRDQLQDFIDFAGDMAEGRNHPVPMVRSADKLLKEIQRAEGAERLRARRFVQLGQYAELHAAGEVDRSVVGETNARMLDDALEAFRSVCRKHLGPVLRRLDPLERFELGDSDPDALVTVLGRTVDALASAQVQGLTPIAPDAETALRELVEGLEDLKSQLAEAQTEERRSYLRRRFTRAFAGSAATVKRLTERMEPMAHRTTKAVDGAIKNHGRWNKLGEIVDWLMSFMA
ncbi:hypothetical protein [uncultured Mameliella sp.]|uniref:hypothetical protein n=1 Tax=uncultured Mameliella sp. TaxID=1447087 RepID=UPI00262BFB18|nr:hypothetical protein [uncultured Mameliella sp.]